MRPERCPLSLRDTDSSSPYTPPPSTVEQEGKCDSRYGWHITKAYKRGPPTLLLVQPHHSHLLMDSKSASAHTPLTSWTLRCISYISTTLLDSCSLEEPMGVALGGTMSSASDCGRRFLGGSDTTSHKHILFRSYQNTQTLHLLYALNPNVVIWRSQVMVLDGERSFHNCRDGERFRGLMTGWDISRLSGDLEPRH